MEVVEENEKKYLVKDVFKKGNWDKEHIVYQWYVKKGETEHVKKKIIFDLLRARILYVSVSKKTETNATVKKVEYLDISDFDPKQYVGVPFVLKRRSIKGKLFLDRFVRSNGNCDFLLEDENEELENYREEEFCVVREVTDQKEYNNQNMTTPFTLEDAAQLDFMLSIFA